MPDNSPSPTDRNRSVIAPVIVGGVVLALLAAAFLSQRQPEPPKPAPATETPVADPPPPPIAAPPPLNRRDIAAAAALQAADYAAGTTPAGKDALIGRRFSLRVPFGCDGPQIGAGAAQAYFEFDPTKRTLKLAARPGDWKSLPMIQALAQAAKVEKAEGFWLPRPWNYSEACPVRREAPVPANPTPAAGPTLGLVQRFDVDGSRVMRRDGRPYEFVRKITDAEVAPLTGSYRLLLEGRVTGFANGRAAACWSESPNHRPICVLGVTYDQVAFEDESGKLLAEWKE